MGHDKRGGAADQDQNARRACGDVTGRYATRHTLLISLHQIWQAQYVSVHSWDACMDVYRHASCMHVSFTRPPALRARQYGSRGSAFRP